MTLDTSLYFNWAAQRAAEVAAIRLHAEKFVGRFAFFPVDGDMYFSGTDGNANALFVIGPKATGPRKPMTAAQIAAASRGGCWAFENIPTNWERLTGSKNPPDDRWKNNAVHAAAVRGELPNFIAGPVFPGGGTLIAKTGERLPNYPNALGIAPTPEQEKAWWELTEAHPLPKFARDPLPPPAETRKPKPAPIVAKAIPQISLPPKFARRTAPAKFPVVKAK